MSTLESVIWHLLGYLAMPMIFVFGFTAVAAGCIWLLHLLGVKPVEQDNQQ